ncbi:MAG: fibronectin type III domain-containing protein [Bacteroidia bacterium]|nr:fibronectin type III domain-containing protein [Bacteroidia bacterium]MDW8157753.1 fibronectin type III domain-containing protein [Bacteroidia bacterium]
MKKVAFVLLYTTIITNFGISLFLPLNIKGQGCLPPQGLNATSVKANAITILWNLTPEASSYRIRWKPEAASTFQIREVSQNNFLISGLAPNTAYAIEIQNVCGNLTSRWSTPLVVTTPEANCNLQLQVSSQHESCFECRNGQIQVNAFNGLPPYAYSLNNGAFTNNSTFSNLPPGNYTITVRDAQQCIRSQNVTILASPCPPPQDISITQTTTHSISFRVVGGSGKYLVNYLQNEEHRNFEAPQNEFTIPNLNPYTQYEFQIFSVCARSYSTPQIIRASTYSQIVPSCPSPNNPPLASEITSQSIYLQWSPLLGVEKYRLSYKSQNQQEWNHILTSQTNFRLTNLLPATSYQFQVQGICKESQSDYSPIGSATTLDNLSSPTCLSPSMPEVQLKNESTIAYISWQPVPTAQEYEIAYRFGNLSNWIIQKTYTPFFVLDNLYPNSTYVVRIRSICINNNTSEFSPEAVFFVPDISVTCIPPLSTQVDSISFTSAKISWLPIRGINNYQIRWRAAGTSQWQITSASHPWIVLSNLQSTTTYEYQVRSFCNSNFSSFSSTFTFTTSKQEINSCPAPGTPLETDITATSAVISWSISYNAIDYELQWRSTNATNWTTITLPTNRYTFNNLLPFTQYEARVRARCIAGISPWSQSCTFTTRPNTTPQCQAPGIIRINNITHQSAILSWSNLQGVSLFEIWYKPTQSNEWQVTISTTDRTANLNGLLSGTEYEIKARGICSSGFSYFSTIFRFTTLGAPECPLPKAPSIVNLRPGQATLSWEIASNQVLEYELQYRKVGRMLWETNVTSQATAVLNDIQQGEYYEFRLRHRCRNGFSLPSESSLGWVPFHTRLNSLSSFGTPEELIVYPNPCTGFLQIQLPSSLGRLRCFNLLGQSVCESQVSSEQKEFSWNLNHLPKGSYWIEYQTHAGEKYFAPLQIVD